MNDIKSIIETGSFD